MLNAGSDTGREVLARGEWQEINSAIFQSMELKCNCFAKTEFLHHKHLVDSCRVCLFVFLRHGAVSVRGDRRPFPSLKVTFSPCGVCSNQ